MCIGWSFCYFVYVTDSEPKTFTGPKQGGNTKNQEYRCSDAMNQSNRHTVRDTIPQEDCRHVGDHHTQGRSSDDGKEGEVLGCEGNRCDLRFVTHLGEEECHERGAEDADFCQCDNARRNEESFQFFLPGRTGNQ